MRTEGRDQTMGKGWTDQEEVDDHPMEQHWVHLLPIGEFRHPHYGLLVVDRAFLEKIKDRFDRGILGREVPVNLEHQYGAEGAAGWLKSLEIRPEGLFGLIEWTDLGKSVLQNKRFRYLSVELSTVYDPTTGNYRESVLTGIALTNRPFFKGLRPLTAKEPQWVVNEEVADLPLDDDPDREWDADESERRWRRWVSDRQPEEWDEDDWNRYRKRFLVVDDANRHLLSAYKLPVADIVKEGPRILRRGVAAAIAALSGARAGVNLPKEIIEKAIGLARQLQEKFRQGGAVEMSDQPLQGSEPFAQAHWSAKAELLSGWLRAMRFSEGRTALSPATCHRLGQVLAELPDHLSRKVLEALSEMQLVPLSEIGFAQASEPEGDFVSLVQQIASSRNLPIGDALKEAASLRPDLATDYYRIRL